MEAIHDVDAWGAIDQLVLDDELARVTAAVGLVCAAPGTRVTLTGLRYGGSLVPRVEPLARSVGIRIRQRGRTADGCTELVVEAATG